MVFVPPTEPLFPLSSHAPTPTPLAPDDPLSASCLCAFPSPCCGHAQHRGLSLCPSPSKTKTSADASVLSAMTSLPTETLS